MSYILKTFQLNAYLSQPKRKPRACAATPSKEAILTTGDRGDAIGQVGKPTPSVATPTQNAIFRTDEHRDAIGHEVGKPTPGIATTLKDVTFTAGEPPDVIRNYARKLTERRDADKIRHI
jgi:hypothetical protein